MRTNKFVTIFGITIALLPCSVTIAHTENTGGYVGAAPGSYNFNNGNLDNNARVIKPLTH